MSDFNQCGVISVLRNEREEHPKHGSYDFLGCVKDDGSGYEFHQVLWREIQKLLEI